VVNKLCCPFCWRFLEVIETPSCPRFRVRGQHSKAFPLALPGWITLDLASLMVQECRAHVFIEILDVLRQHKLQQARLLEQDPKRCFSMDGSEGHCSISSEQSHGSLSPSVTSNSSITSGGHSLSNPHPDHGQKSTDGFFRRCTAFFSANILTC
jgi:hypothetical protein